MAAEKPSISLQVKVFIDPSKLDEFFKAWDPVYAAVCAEPELTFFEVYHNPDKPGELKWVENWNGTADWLMAVQLKKEYYKPYLEATMPLYVKDREFEIWTRYPENKWVYVADEMLKKP